MVDADSDQTFLFADLAGFTALTEVHGDELAADLAERFCDSVCELLPGYGAERIKSIGDGLMLRLTDPDRGVRLAVRIVTEFGATRGFPSVRIGLHTGAAIVRGGDWFGATVNLAARVGDLAAEREVLMTRATRDAVVWGNPLTELRPRGCRRLKNIRDPVELFAAVIDTRDAAAGHPRDPVCLMGVDLRADHEHEVFEGRSYSPISAARTACVTWGRTPGPTIRRTDEPDHPPGRALRRLRPDDEWRAHAARRRADGHVAGAGFRVRRRT